MSRTIINVSAIIDASRQINSAKTYVSSAKSSFTQTKNSIDGKIKNRYNINERLCTVQRQLSNIDSKIGRIRSTVQSGANQYRVTDDKVVAWRGCLKNNVGAHSIGIVSGSWASYFKNNDIDSISRKDENKTKDTSDKKNFKLWSWGDTWKMVGCAGIVGSVISTVGGAITGGKSVKTGLDTTKGVAKIVENIAKAVPKTSTSSFDWKTLFGFNTVITKDTPKSIGKAIGESIDKLKFGKAKTVSDNVAVGAKWAGYAITAVTTTYENFTDTTENNSTGRKVAESIGETAVKIGEGMLIGAAVTAAYAAASVAAPAVLVAGTTVLVTWAVDKVCEVITGKDVAEFVSDTVLDAGEKIIADVGKGAKKVAGKISGWWKNAFG